MIPRPDEIAAISDIERDKRLRGMVKSGISSAASIPLAAGAVGAMSKIAPFLNEYVPLDLAIKGISKLSPTTGAFLKKGQEMGLDIKEGLDFLRGRVESQQSQSGKGKDKTDTQRPSEKNIVEQYSPELHSFIVEQMNQGRSPLEAGALAALERKGQKNFKKIISQMERDHKSPFSSILQATYGGKEGMAQRQESQQTNSSSRLADALDKLASLRGK